LCFTSGTTGKSKAATITTNVILDTLKDACANNTTYGRMLTFKAFHAKSSIAILMLMAIIKGAQVCLSCASPVDEIYQNIQKHKINFLIGSPYNIAVMVLNSEYINKNYDLSSVEYVYMGGSAASKELVIDTAILFDACVGAYYGASEIRMPFKTTSKSSAIGSIGTLKPSAEIRIVDEDGNDAKVGEPGELLVKGPGTTKGYYNNPEATAKAFTKDGYYRTGDIMKQDADGFFWFLSRCSHLIKCYPMSFYAYEVEDVVKLHARVFECVVIGVFQKKLSREYPRAYVTLVDEYDDKETETIANDIMEYANKQLSELKQIRCGVVIKKSFDRTSTGKVNYAILKQDAEKVQ
jgi:acyl-CoA synthetase (AMP-forming)/AMP-acid ligase II